MISSRMDKCTFGLRLPPHKERNEVAAVNQNLIIDCCILCSEIRGFITVWTAVSKSTAE